MSNGVSCIYYNYKINFRRGCHVFPYLNTRKPSEATIIPTQVAQVIHKRNHAIKYEGHDNKWFDVAVGIKHGIEN